MIYGIGIDSIEVSRIKDTLSRWNGRFIRRVFTRTEIACLSNKKSRDEYYSVRFAAKEAFLKSLGLGLRDGISWLDIEIINDALGKPVINLFGKAKEIAEKVEIRNIFVSLSHTKNLGIAVVVLES